MNPDLYITPAGTLRLGAIDSPPENLSKAAWTRLHKAFNTSTAAGMLALATDLLNADLPAHFAWCRTFAQRYLTALCQTAALAGNEPLPVVPLPTPELLNERLQTRPTMFGGEYLTTDTLQDWWSELDQRVRKESGKQAVTDWLEKRQPAWRAVGRVTLHLAENKRNKTHPFAFLATYVDGVADNGVARHVTLAFAIESSADAADSEHLIALLTPIQRAAEKAPWLHTLIDNNALYQPLAWTPPQALEFLQSVEHLQAAGLGVRTPDWWQATHQSRPKVTVTVGSAKHTSVGVDALLDFSVEVALEGQSLSSRELATLLQADDADGLVQLKGRWIELDRERLSEVLNHWQAAEQRAADGVSFAEAMRWMSGADVLPAKGGSEDVVTAGNWVGIEAGPWLRKTLAQLRDPGSIRSQRIPGLKAELRAYQVTGVNWLRFMTSLQLGACLADDMGLGKTVQVLALLLQLRAVDKRKSVNREAQAAASLLIVPASLLSNWRAEAARFSPSLTLVMLHPSEAGVDLKSSRAITRAVKTADLVVTTYGMLSRLPALAKHSWRLVVLDEAQAIRNPGTRQSKAVRQLNAGTRIALTGTPVENSLADLWSLFDFLNPGLLGNASEFKRFIKRLQADEQTDYSPLRQLVSPYILRRLKTDKRVIDDLPDKTEVKRYCSLSKMQARLYQASVRELSRQLEEADGIQRRGLVLAYLMRFKQICNHPAQWQGTGDYKVANSGKLQQLVSLCEELAERQERLLVFTQFREITEPLSHVLSQVFGQPGLVLHGGTSIKRRQSMVNSFQQADGPPYFILSLKAGGTGLNLTAASQVVHFDRWWNPAVENQATDRAFRIGQKRNVLVHKFVCRGTVEERIDTLISEKTALADAVLNTDGGKILTEMSDAELLEFVALDINSAVNA